MSGILAMVLIVNPLMLVPLAGAIVLFYGVVKLYTKPAQDMKRLEGICKLHNAATTKYTSNSCVFGFLFCSSQSRVLTPDSNDQRLVDNSCA